MARSPRTHPFFASDVQRSVFAPLIGLVLGFVAVVLVLRLDLNDSDAPRVLGFLVAFITWAFIVGAIVVMTLLVFARPEPAELQRWLRETTPEPGLLRRFGWATLGGGAVPWAVAVTFTTIGVLVSIATTGELRRSGSVIATGITIAAIALAEIIVAFAVRYAREDATRGGFAFPGGARVAFASYLYLSVQVTLSYSASDVEVTGSSARGLVAVHALLSFLFNSVIVAMLVSVLISAAMTG